MNVYTLRATHYSAVSIAPSLFILSKANAFIYQCETNFFVTAKAGNSIR